MINVTICHRRDDWCFFPMGEARSQGVAPALSIAYNYELDTEPGLLTDIQILDDHVWRANNRLDGSDVERLPEDARSLSVGDVVILTDGHHGPDRCYEVAAIGWVPVLSDVVAAAFMAPSGQRFVE